MSDMKASAEQGIDYAKAKIKAAANVMSDAADSVGERFSQGKDAVADGYSRLKERASDAYDDAYEAASGWEESLEQTIRRRPLQTVLVAASVGVLIGWLCRKR
jgi:ElaB/YqjD/DUF883 family membrane-anchored ribosome-binding protein